MEFVYENVTYITTPETARNSCKGCAFDHDDSQCNKACEIAKCGFNSVIWIKKEAEVKSKYEIAQEVLTEFSKQTNCHTLGEFIEWLGNVKDPEYVEYQRLKEKFEE